MQTHTNPPCLDRRASGRCTFDANWRGLEEETTAGHERTAVFRIGDDQAIRRISRMHPDGSADLERLEIDPVGARCLMLELRKWLRCNFKHRVVCGHDQLPSAPVCSKQLATLGHEENRPKSPVCGTGKETTREIFRESAGLTRLSASSSSSGGRPSARLMPEP